MDLTDYKCSTNAEGKEVTGHQFTFAKDVTLNMNKHTITSNNYGVTYQGDNLKIMDGNFTAKGKYGTGTGNYALFIRSNGIDTEGKVTAGNNTAYLSNVKCTGGINVSEHNLVIDNDCVIDGDGTEYRALWAQSSAEITVNSGTFIGGKGNILGGDSTSTITVNGGIFNKGKSNTGSLCYVDKNTGKVPGTIIITGGTFDFIPTEYVDKTKYNITPDNTTGPWTVEKISN